jgi:hypothetical protein
MTYRKLASPLAVLTAVFLGACQDIVAPGVNQSATASSRSTSDASGRNGWMIDQEFARIAREEILGFAGYFVDKEGRFTVQLKNPTHRDRAITALSKAFARQEARGIPGPGVANARILQAQYDYVELKQWRDQARHLLGVSGLHSLEIDDMRNRIRIGVDGEAARSSIRAQLVMLGIPAQAAIVEVREPILPGREFGPGDPVVRPQNMGTGESGGGSGSVMASSLTDKYRPLVGGLEIWFQNDDDNLYYPCTYGVNVRESSFYGMQFVTASHCSRVIGTADATRYTQGDYVVTEPIIGYEREDPWYTSAPSSTGSPCRVARCRYSDVSVSVLHEVNFNFGEIARTQSSQTTSGSTVIGSRFKITAEYDIPYAPPYVGMPLDKIGITTGWTTGTVSSPCVDLIAVREGIEYGFYCQTVVNAGADKGDSGAPVFRRTKIHDEVIFYGILWGGSPGSFVFSSLQNIWGDKIGITTAVPHQVGT